MVGCFGICSKGNVRLQKIKKEIDTAQILLEKDFNIRRVVLHIKKTRIKNKLLNSQIE